MIIRTSISKKNPYWVPKHRFLELYHFSLQYKDWVKELADTIYIPSDPEFDPTGNIAARITRLKTNCELVKRCCTDADSVLQKFIFMVLRKDTHTILSGQSIIFLAGKTIIIFGTGNIFGFYLFVNNSTPLIEKEERYYENL